ncbi:MAG TPA: aryl-sulfate sulfotransferase, partial [Bacteroidota bacterium]|nr:aryl-sulfate sulfotransferase [Bacteroidota bacterium]
MKSSEKVDPSSLSPNEFSVVGSASGTHAGIVKLSDDNKTILFFPTTPFSANENVVVNIHQGIKTTGGEALPLASIHFKTTPLTQKLNVNLSSLMDEGTTSNPGQVNKISKPKPRIASTNTLPVDFPPITVDSSNNPASGNIFMTNLSLAPSPSIGYYLMVLNNDGTPARYRKLSEWGVDFKIQPNGELSYAYVTEVLGTLVEGTYVVMDTTLTPLDTISVGNGYTTYPSDFLLLPNGHALLMGLEVEPYDMSPYGGSPNADVVGDIIQEIDASKNVVFQWRTLDYIPITDSYIPLNTQTVDLIHANAFDVDQNGDIIFSMRHCSTVIKIDRQSGNIDWFLGGKENQFSFVNEDESNSPDYFSFQHDVRWQPNGDITLFDNGNQHVPNYSRGVEYQLDQQNKIATLVWQYRHTPDIYAPAMGSVERLANGNTLIGWGEATA